MRYIPDHRGMAAWLLGPESRRVTTLAAAARMAKARALMQHDTGETAASGRLVHGRGGRRNDRHVVSIVFGGTAVIQQFGNKRRRATRPLTRAMEG